MRKGSRIVFRCRHCKRARKRARRGLCFTCYWKPELRYKYPMLRAVCQHDIDRTIERTTKRPPKRVSRPCTPTTALPNTEAKIEVLRQRAANREELWHPQDARAGL